MSFESNRMDKIIRAGVGVLLKKENKILLGKRHLDALEEGYKVRKNNILNTWTMPGGKIELGETIVECAKRETFEETGITLNEAKVFFVNDATESNGYFITIGLISEDFFGEPKTMEQDKITDWQWFDLDNLPSPLFEPSKQMIENYLAGKFYISI